MEAAITDFQQWVASLPVTEVSYYAVFDNFGAVTAVYPNHAAEFIENKILIDNDVAESILNGSTTMSSYVVDLTNANLEFIEVRSLTKIDDVLHRIVNSKWSTVEFNDIFLTYNRQEKCLTIELSASFNGTKVTGNESAPLKKIHWVNSTEMLFLFTHYNDPHFLDKSISVKMHELIENKKVVNNLELPKNFSVYTRRLFKNYVIEEI